MEEGHVEISLGEVTLEGNLIIPQGAKGIVLFAHGSGSSRHSPRNQYVAKVLREAKLGTLLIDLLTREEEIEEQFTRHLRFDIALLTERLAGVAKWLLKQAPGLKIGVFGASTGAAAALALAATAGKTIGAVVSRGGRPDLAGDFLRKVRSPTLLIVGGADDVVIGMNEEALEKLCCEKQLVIVPGATHLFEEPGTLEEVARLAKQWFVKHLTVGKSRDVA